MIHETPITWRMEAPPLADAEGGDARRDTSTPETVPLRSVFESAAYREAYGIGNVLRAEIADGRDVVPLMFDDRGDHAICLALTATLDATAIEQASAALFKLPRIRFLVFEDIHVDGPVPSKPVTHCFRYHNDWVLPLDGAEGGIPRSIRRRKDQNLRRLERQHDGIRLVIEPSPGRDIVEEAIRLSRLKIEASGRSYLIDEEERDRLVRLFGASGVAAVLYHGDRVVSVDLFAQNGQEAYLFMGGYDSAYAKESPGIITMRHGVEHFENRGFRSVHFMWGDGSYKARLGAVKVPLSTLVIPRNGASWLGVGLFTTTARFSLLDMKRRLKGHSWLGEPLLRAQQVFFRLRATVRRET